jgi:hypothetical protein
MTRRKTTELVLEQEPSKWCGSSIGILCPLAPEQGCDGTRCWRAWEGQQNKTVGADDHAARFAEAPSQRRRRRRTDEENQP